MSGIINQLRPYLNLNVIQDRATCNCPFCMDKDKTMVVSDQTDDFKCFTCGETGNADYFFKRLHEVQEVKNIDPKLFKKQPYSPNEYEQRLLELNNEAAKYFYHALMNNQKAYKYLQDREIPQQAINHFGLGYASGWENDLYKYLLSKGYSLDDMKEVGLVNVLENNKIYDCFKDRIVFPIINTEGDIVGFGGRRINDELTKVAKYYNSKDSVVFNKSNNLFGLNFAQKSQIKGVILCEGYMDVIALHKSGFINSVASLGTAFNENHISVLRNYTDSVYLCFDNDQAGINAKLKAIPLLRKHGFEVNVIDLSPYKDPDEFIKALGTTEFANRVSTSVDSYYYEISTLLQKYQNQIDSKEFLKELGQKMASASEKDTEIYTRVFNMLKNEHLEFYSNNEFINENEETATEENNDNIIRIQNLEDDTRVAEHEELEQQEIQEQVQGQDFTIDDNKLDDNGENPDDIFGFDDIDIDIY